MTNGPRILTLDIETQAHLVWTFGLFKQNIGINQIKKPGRVLGVGYKWLDKPKARFVSEFHHGREAMLQEVWDQVNEADAVVTYNGAGFDMPWLDGEWWESGLTEPSPYKNIDLYRTVKSRMRRASGKLDWIAYEAGLGHKTSTGGFDLWKGCEEGDTKAWARMRSYCLRDVRLTEDLYLSLRPWIKSHPHVGLYGPTVEENVCQTCGSANVQKRGYAYTNLGRYQRWQCVSAGCGRWSRGKKLLDSVDLRGTS